MIAVVLLGGRPLQGSGDFIAFGWIVVYDVSGYGDGAVGSLTS
jgi:hypothetical protein